MTSQIKKYLVKGYYTQTVEKIIEANSVDEAFKIATNNCDPMLEWDSDESGDTYREEITDVLFCEGGKSNDIDS